MALLMRNALKISTILLVALISPVASMKVDGSKTTLVSIRQHADYRNFLTALNTLVAQNAKHRKNTFYVSKLDVTFESGDELYIADVYWKEDNSIILLESHSTDWPHALLWSRRYWRLDRDVVPTLNDVAGSNYLLTRAESRRMIRRCLQGDRFVVQRRATKS